MKKLQLMKYIAGELVKGNQMVKGRTKDGFIAYADGYKLWIIREEDDIFSDSIDKIDIDKILKTEDIDNLKAIDNYLIIDGTDVMKNKKIARGVIDNIPFYFDIDYLKYFDKNCKLYKYSDSPTTPIYIKDEYGALEGLIMPINLTDETKKELDKKLGL